MSVILVFLLVVIGFGLWWLAQQRIMSKPWLEVGPDPAGGPGDLGMPTEKLALAVFLAVVGALFALFASAYVMRTEYVDWRPMPLPRIVWVNTVLLVLASILLQCARVALRRGDAATARLGLGGGLLATVAFLLGQLAAWRELVETGFLMTGSPANSFFYLLTGLHGLHIVGGLVALATVLPMAWMAPVSASTLLQDSFVVQKQWDYRDFTVKALPGLASRLELCTTYWHFLLLVWLGLLVLFTGWAAEAVAICRALLT